MKSKELLKGTLKTIILKLLAENGRMYGYEITQKVKELSNEEIQLTFGALYPILHKLEADGLLVTESEIVDNRARKYYSLTPAGNEIAKEKIEQFFEFMDIMKQVIGPSPSPKSKLNLWGI